MVNSPQIYQGVLTNLNGETKNRMSLSACCISGFNMVNALDDLFVGNGGRINDTLYEVSKQV